MPEQVTRNARIGAVALAIFAPLHGVVGLFGAMFAPLGFMCWLGVSFGVLCLSDELGAAKPLNRAGLILFGTAFCARLLMTLASEPMLHVRAEIAFAFATLGALLLWSVALMHRPHAPRTVGLFGLAVSGSTLALILSAHLLMGSVTIWGFGTLFAALADPALDTGTALATINAIVALWALIMSGMLWTRNLRSAPE